VPDINETPCLTSRKLSTSPTSSPEADRRLTEHDVRAEAERMLEAHPDPDVGHKELALVIREEERTALAEGW
jgi:hypothetical protein